MEKKIYLCQPWSYELKPKSQKTRQHACNNWQHIYPDTDVDCFATDIRSSSLLEGFNSGVTAADNAGVDYFAMIHSDMTAPPGWLAHLIKGMDDYKLDMIHASACIKDERYLTNTAIAYSLDPWSLKRRISLKEAHALPDVYTIEDVRREIDPDALAILPNPGCMVMRVGQWFKDWEGFNTLSRKYTRPDGTKAAQTITEDWVFGYWAASQNPPMRIGVAGPRLVTTGHIGEFEFSTQYPRGFECDRDYFIAIGKPPVGAGRWVFPGDVEGWLTMTEAKALTRLANGKRVLEIGSYCGKSTICMSQAAESVVAVDPHDGRATDKPRSTLFEMLGNLAKYQVSNVTVEKTTSADWIATYQGEPFDLVFIDGAHDYDSVRFDQYVALKVVKPGGVIAFHDYRKHPREHDGGWDPGVTQAVNEFVAENGFEMERAGTVAIVQVSALVNA